MVYLLQQLLMESARRNTDKQAVVCGEDALTYGELDAVSDKLAALLVEKGTRKGDRVGIYINKSIPSVVSLLGILKAGGVYVPLDAGAPPARLAYMIRDCGVKCLLTSTKKAASLADMFPEANPLELVVLTDGGQPPRIDPACQVVEWASVLARESAGPPLNSSIERDLAYILYTSGSTGEPKGVMISHRTSLTFVNWVHSTFGITAGDRLSNHAPLHFDLSILDLFVTFQAGATVFLVPESLSMFPVRLAEWIEENRISIWYSVPSILSLLVLHARLEEYDFSALRIVFFAGEVFPVKTLRELMHKIPGAEYYNLFGPTETNVITYYKVPVIGPEQSSPIAIGKACANTHVFAVTNKGQWVTQPGQRGELYARGPGVADGYWGDPAKTRKRFVRNRRQPHFVETVYKTGDIVTLDENGDYLFLGRRDHMIKSRGYRIELGEIETALYSHGEIEEAAVVGIPDDVVSHRIKAFVVPHNGTTLSPTDVRLFCSDKLPKYMVPEIIEFRDVLPKTSTGKINKSLLLRESQEPARSVINPGEDKAVGPQGAEAIVAGAGRHAPLL